jgi:hypothetical protein
VGGAEAEDVGLQGDGGVVGPWPVVGSVRSKTSELIPTHTTASQHATEAAKTRTLGTLEPLRAQLLVDAVAGQCLLLVIVVLGVKPRGHRLR